MSTDKEETSIGAVMLGIVIFLIAFICIGGALEQMESCSQRHAIMREK